MFERKILRGLMLAMVLALVVALLLPMLALADKGEPPVSGLVFATHDVGTINLRVDDDGGYSGYYLLRWPCPPCTAHMDPHTNFMVGNSSDALADGEWNADWNTLTAINIQEPGPMAEYGTASYDDSGLGRPLLGLHVDQYSCAWGDPPYDDFVLVAYNIRNVSGGPLTGLYAGHFVEFDVDVTAANDYASYDSGRHLARQWESSWVGLMYLTEAPSSYQNHFWGSHPTNDATAYALLSAGTIDAQLGPADVGFTMAIGPFDLADNEVMLLGTAWVGGSSEADLEANADQALEMWEASHGCVILEVEEEFVPEPGSVVLLASGLMGLAGYAGLRLRKK